MEKHKFKVGDIVKVKKNAVILNIRTLGGMRNSQKTLDG